MDTKRVMGIGSNVVDVIYRVNQIAGPETKTYILPDERGRVVQEVVGGVTLNHLSWARLLGVPTGLFGYQGDDRYGLIIRSTMDRHGIDRSHVVIREGEATGFSVIYVDPEGERCIYMSRGPSGTTRPENIRADFVDAIVEAALVSTEISQLALDTVIAVLETAKEAGVRTVLDVDVPPDFCIEVAKLGSRQELERCLELADVIKPAKAAASQLTDADTAEKQAEALLARYGGEIVAITDGRAGSVLTDGRHTYRIPANELQAVDTTGAGDAFLGGLIAGVYHDLPLEKTGELANACAGACCLVLGAFPVLDRSLTDVIEFFGDELPGELLEMAAERPDTSDHVGMQVLRREINALQAVEALLDVSQLDAAVELVLRAERNGHRLHVTGVGKCRHIGHKITATLQSTGTPAYFLDPLDANHGDSGQVVGGDVVLCISHSGKTAELLTTVDTVRALGAHIIGMTGQLDSPLAERSDVVIHIPVEREADPLGLAPTSSTTCQLAVGDAFAMMLARERHFTADDFHKYHPGGSLGERLRS